MRFRDVERMLKDNGYLPYRRCNGSHTLFMNEKGLTILASEHHNGEYPRQFLKRLEKQIKENRLKA